MKDNRLSLLCAAALAFGCSAGVSGKTGSGGSNGTGTGGSSGSTASGGHGGSSSTGGSNGTGGSSSTGGVSGTDASLDGACAASTVGAQPVPLDLYFLMDSSKSMNEHDRRRGPRSGRRSARRSTPSSPTRARPAWEWRSSTSRRAVETPATCTVDSDCTVSGTATARATRRKTCVADEQVDHLGQSPLPDRRDCGSRHSMRPDSSSAGPTTIARPADATGTCAASCTTFPGYCHLRDICTPSEYATPERRSRDAPRRRPAGSTPRSTGHSPDGYTPTGPALGEPSCGPSSSRAATWRTRSRSCW